jgi:hypothetical protein
MEPALVLSARDFEIGSSVSPSVLEAADGGTGFLSMVVAGFACGLVGAGAVLEPTTAEMEPALVLSARDLAIGSSASPSSLAAAGTGFFPGWTVVGFVGPIFFSSSGFVTLAV